MFSRFFFHAGTETWKEGVLNWYPLNVTRPFFDGQRGIPIQDASTALFTFHAVIGRECLACVIAAPVLELALFAFLKVPVSFAVGKFVVVTGVANKI